LRFFFGPFSTSPSWEGVCGVVAGTDLTISA
jgi:hypothetical protein